MPWSSQASRTHATMEGTGSPPQDSDMQPSGSLTQVISMLRLLGKAAVFCRAEV